ncbi:MAG: phosphodiester glycosidase family protein [Clostridia bacterium]|nr:phosphodiester glycosidase family protein [Clostridia bacterium]
MAAGLCALLLCVIFTSGVSEEYRELTVGMSGSDVQRLKKAMYWLGYFNTQDLDGNYTQTTAERVKRLQRNNGLEETGVADAALQELVFSGNAVKTANAPKPSPTPGPSPTPIPVMDVEALMPPRTADGFLAPEAGVTEFVYADQDAGVWIYVSPNLAIVINRYQETLKKYDTILWYEADIRCTPESPLNAWLTEGKKQQGATYENPQRLARKHQAVLAFADDHFGFRRNKGRTVGVIIRNGEIHGNKTYRAGNSGFPNLDVLAVFEDGRMETFVCDAHTAQEYLDMGVVQTYAFGPILIHDGQLADDMLMEGRYTYREPRCALGMIAPYHYYAVVAKGRTSTTNGVTIPWVARLMLERGVTEALNLDGGGTATLMFMGEVLNRKSVKDLRSVTSITGFGQSDLVPAP